MIYLTPEIAIKLNHFRTKDGQEALKTLASLLYDEYVRLCLRSEGNALYVAQGKAQLADWLLGLPQGLANASTGSNSTVG